MTAAHREEEIALLDAEIANIESQLYQLRARRNSLTQLCHLPDEVIARIIWHQQVYHVLKNSDKRRYLHTAFGDFDHAWAHVTRVCQHIRRVALATPYLWSILECRQDEQRIQWSQLSLERARDTALTVYVTLDKLVHKQTTSPIHLLNKAAASTRHLHVDVSSDILEKDGTSVFLAHLIEMTLPRLEWLKTSVSPNYMLTSQFLDGRCDRLVRASITNLNLGRAQPPQLTALIWLHLAVSEIGPHGAGLRAVLIQCPSLECLDIQADGRTLPNKQLPFVEQKIARADKLSQAQVHLPNLRILHVTAKITWIAFILLMVPTPSEALYIENTSGRHLHRKRAVEEIIPWDFSSDSARTAHEIAHNALITFWTQASGNEDDLLPDVRIVTAIIDATVNIGYPFLPKHVTPGSRTPFLHYHSRASLDNYIPLAEHITTIHFRDSVGLSHTAARAMGHVKRVIVEKVMNIESLGVLPMWVEMLSEEGRPLQRIEFATCSIKFVRQYALTLAETGLVEEVIWEGELL
jgi:hypothetical protein